MENQLLNILPSLLLMMSRPGTETSWITLLVILIPCFIPYISKQSWSCPRIRSSKLEYTARIKTEEWSEFPSAVVSCFSNVAWEWIRQNKVINLPMLREEVQHQRNYYSNDGIKRQIPFFMDHDSQFFWHADRPHIRYCMWMNRDVDKDGYEHPTIQLKIQLEGTDPTRLVEHIDWIKEESERISKLKDLKQQVLVSMEAQGPRGMRDDDDSPSPSIPFMIHEFFTTSSFNNFFSEEATIVKKELDQFLQGKKDYERIGRPWNYSLLNTGAPGVGKTKLVKAIAEYTGRTLIVLHLQHITSPLLLHQVFHSSLLSGINIPHEKRLYYIPEVDTQLLEIVKKREVKPTLVLKEGEEKKEKEVEKKPSVTLGDILNVLDGVPERKGHILILDTNRLEELDPALIRPGRIDRVIEWKKLSSASARKMMEHYYNQRVPVVHCLSDQKWSAAELQSILHRSNTMKEALWNLVKEDE
jgi:hypothetical protein